MNINSSIDIEKSKSNPMKISKGSPRKKSNSNEVNTLFYASSAITVLSAAVAAYAIISLKGSVSDMSREIISSKNHNAFYFIQSLAVVGHICASGYYFYLTRKDTV
jgi:hypothetical protein